MDWELDYKESWVLKNWCFWTAVLEKTTLVLRVPWTARRSNQSILKEISPGCSLEGLMLKVKLQYFWPPDTKSWHIGKDPDAGKDRGQEEKGTLEDEMVGWHHRLNGHEFEYTLGVGDGQGGLACCVVHGVAKSRGRLSNWTELNWRILCSRYKSFDVLLQIYLLVCFFTLLTVVFGRACFTF